MATLHHNGDIATSTAAGQISPATSTRAFGWRDKFGYMCGDIATDSMFLFASSWFMIFYTKVMGISGVAVGTLFLLARVLDAFMDVSVGVIADRARDRKGGKFRSIMMMFTMPLAVMSFLMYQSFCIDSPLSVKIAYMAVTYVVWCFFYSCVNIPFGSMASTISPEADDHTSLSTMRSMGGTLAGLILGVVVPLVVYQKDAHGHQIIRSGDHSTVFAMVAGAVSIVAFLCYLLCYFNVNERVRSDMVQTTKADETRSPLRMIRNAFSSKSMLGIISGALCLLIAQLFSNQLMTFVFTNYFGSATLASLSGFIGTLVMFLVVPFIKPLTRRFGRKTICGFASATGAIAMFVLYLSHTHSGIVFLIGTVFMYLALMGFNLVVWAMITDVIDDIEVERGTREEATCFSCYSFARKIGQAVAGELAGLSLDWIGYRSGSTAVQSEVTKQGLYNIATLVPALFFFLTFLCIVTIYPLSRDRVIYNVEVLRIKRKGLSSEEARLVAQSRNITPTGIDTRPVREWPDYVQQERARALAQRVGLSDDADGTKTAVTGRLP